MYNASVHVRLQISINSNNNNNNNNNNCTKNARRNMSAIIQLIASCQLMICHNRTRVLCANCVIIIIHTWFGVTGVLPLAAVRASIFGAK